MLKIIDRYVLRLVLTPMAATLVISLTLLLAERMLGFLDLTLGKKNSFTAVFKMLAYLVPNYLGLAVPIAIFLGVLFGFNKFSKSHEIDALQAAGINLPRLFRPVLMLVFVLMLCNLVAVGWLQPYGRYSYRSVIYTLTNVDAYELAQARKTFNESLERKYFKVRTTPRSTTRHRYAKCVADELWWTNGTSLKLV